MCSDDKDFRIRIRSECWMPLSCPHKKNKQTNNSFVTAKGPAASFSSATKQTSAIMPQRPGVSMIIVAKQILIFTSLLKYYKRWNTVNLTCITINLFILNLTTVSCVLHFLDSAKEHQNHFKISLIKEGSFLIKTQTVHWKLLWKHHIMGVNGCKHLSALAFSRWHLTTVETQHPQNYLCFSYPARIRQMNTKSCKIIKSIFITSNCGKL